jgi:hypothetical protein
MVTARRNDEIRLAEYLLNRSLEQVTGRSEDLCLDDRPRSKYFVGTLANRPFDPDDLADSQGDDDLYSRLSPSAMGLEVLVEPRGPGARLTVRIRFNVYYRIFPDLNQQRRISDYTPIPPGTAGPAPTAAARPGDWAIAYRKLPITVAAVDVTLPAQITGREALNTTAVHTAISDALDTARQLVRSDPQRYREPGARRVVPAAALDDEQAYARFLQQAIAGGQEIEPQWQAQLQVEALPETDGRVRVSVMLLNVSAEDANNASPTDHYLFDVGLEVEGQQADLHPFVFEVVPEEYKYNRELWGLGRNCSVNRLGGGNAVQTENAPIYCQPVYTTRDAVDPTLPKATFQGLADDPLPVLRDIAAAMDRYGDDWGALMTLRSGDPDWDPEMLEAAQGDLGAFVQEIARFRRGIEALERFDLLRRAFQLMNQTFVNGSRYRQWRLFQIVYIVTQLPAVAAREYDVAEWCEEWDYVDVLWFPTGGGKSESYLGLIVCTAFFDRLRGKKAGVSAWMRFPLRLLSLQQLQRLADITGAAELLRRQTPGVNGADHDPFSVGYMVGKANTPNKLTESAARGQPSWLQRLQGNPELLQSLLTIPSCPFCGRKTVEMALDPDRVRLLHRCTNPQCPSAAEGGVLPIYIVDNEVYRYLPTVLAGTIDKVTAVGYQRKFSHLYGGAVNQRCPTHGYMSLGECTEKDAPCQVPPRSYARVTLKDPSPTLQIQDELHLLREELGAFDGHYETFIDEYQQRRHGGARQKIIAATATIEEYENQIAHLYDRKARRFPVPGPELGESFYATTEHDDTRRLFVGIMPHNYTHINAVVRLAELFHREVEDLRRDPTASIVLLGLQAITSPTEFLALLSNYEVHVTYLLSKREGDRARQSFEGQLNRELTGAGYTEVMERSITGDVAFTEVSQILDELKEPDPDFARRLRAIVATSAISHGVDVERINYMCFFGMPRSNAEYIQASSRAGRDHPGVVLVVFNPARERDQSHYHFFNKYHEYLDRLVEPVPINRWSKFSINRTIPGLFMGLLLSDYNLTVGGSGRDSLYFSSKVRRLIESGQITPADIITYLRQAYRTAGRDAGQEFDEVIEHKVNDYIDMLRNPEKNFTSDNLPDSPMQSLRDTDEQLNINLNRDSQMLASGLTRRRI